MSASAKHAELKRLESQLTKTKLELEEAKSQSSEVQRKVTNLNSRIKDLVGRMDNLKRETEGIVFTDHAIIRYFERVLGYDIEEIKKAMMPDKTAVQVDTLVSGIFPVSPKFRIRVKDRVVVTVLPPEGE